MNFCGSMPKSGAGVAVVIGTGVWVGTAVAVGIGVSVVLGAKPGPVQEAAKKPVITTNLRILVMIAFLQAGKDFFSISFTRLTLFSQ